MRVYIAGPMTGRKMNNIYAFFKAAAWLREQGHQVVNPAELDLERGVDPSRPLEEQGLKRADILCRDFRALMACDAIHLLDGWETSEGAQAEKLISRLIGLKNL